MSQLQTSLQPEVIYPDSDGQPMADNTEQFRWIVFIQQNLESLFADDPKVFVAGDLLWYPVEGDNKTCVAPDVLVAFGRPKGYRGSYQQWQEGNIAPQVVFEVLSPGNTQLEMHKKLRFYERYGVEEYYLYDSLKNDFSGWRRQDDRLEVIDPIDDWFSPVYAFAFTWLNRSHSFFAPMENPSPRWIRSANGLHKSASGRNKNGNGQNKPSTEPIDLLIDYALLASIQIVWSSGGDRSCFELE